MDSGSTHEEALFISLDKMSIFLDEDDDLEEQITHLFKVISQNIILDFFIKVKVGKESNT